MTSESVKLTAIHPSSARQQATATVAAPFLTPGHLILFTPGRQLRELVLYKIKSLEHRLILVRHTSVFVVLRRSSSDADSDDWHYISCAGMSGWIFIPAELKESLSSVSSVFGSSTMAFRSVPSILRYQDWKGNNHFFCGGRVMLGPDLGYFCLTNVGMIILFVAHLHILASYHVPDNSVSLSSDSPINRQWLDSTSSSSFLAVDGLLFSIVLMNLWLTALTEPGIVPRRPAHRKDGPVDHCPGNKFCPKCNQYCPPRCLLSFSIPLSP